MKRFDYVKYDEIAVKHQENFKAAVTQVEQLLGILPEGRPKSIVFTKLEEVYMWIGKAIRDDQIKRNGSAEPQEQRKDG